MTFIGTTLVSNTMTCEAARLLQPVKSMRSPKAHDRIPSLRRVVDLMALIDAAVLHDTVYTLPARLRADADNLAFRDELVRNDLIKELDTTKSHEPIARSLLRWLSSVPDPVTVAGSSSQLGKPIDFARLSGEVASFLQIAERTPSSLTGRTSVTLDDTHDVEVSGGTSEVLEAQTFHDFGRALIGWIEYRYSGAYEECTSVLRDAYYILTAEHFGLPYWPQTTRIEFAKTFPNYFTSSQRLAVYNALAEVLNCSATDVFDDHKEEQAFAPPFAAVLLSRCRTIDDIPMRLAEMRDEYASLRENLNRLEQERLASTSIRARLRLRNRQQILVSDIAARFEKPSLLSMEAVIRYVPNVISVVAAPTDPTKYAADLLLKPAGALAKWWLRRPLSKLFALEERLKDLSGYQHDVTRLFGEEILNDSL